MTPTKNGFNYVATMDVHRNLNNFTLQRIHCHPHGGYRNNIVGRLEKTMKD